MKKKSTSQSAPARRSLGEGGFFNLRFLIACVFCLFGVFVALLGSGVFAQTKGTRASQQPARSNAKQDAPGTQTPEVTRMVGPVVVNADLRDLPVVPPGPKIDRPLLKPGLHGTRAGTESEETSAFPQFRSLLGKIFRPVPNMPPPLLTFDGISSAESFCGCEPPDTIGDVGPNHYVETNNTSIKVFDKSGGTLLAAVSFDTFFAPLGAGTPCGTGLNQGDPYSFYDHVADRWVVSDFGFASFGGNPSYECIGVSQTSDPVAGGRSSLAGHLPSALRTAHTTGGTIALRVGRVWVARMHEKRRQTPVAFQESGFPQGKHSSHAPSQDDAHHNP